VSWKQTHIGRIIDTDDLELQKLIMECYFSTERFMKVFLPNLADGVWTEQRSKGMALLDDDTIPYGYECGYRGIGKTTKMIAKTVQNFCYRKFQFVVYLGKDEGFAIEQTEAVKNELLNNNNIVEVFGHMRPQSMNGVAQQFSRKAFFLSDPVTNEAFGFCNPRGIGQSIRGRRVTIQGRSVRPDFLICDDGEDDDEIMNPDYRVKYRRYFYGAFLKCVSADHMPNPKTGRWDKPAYYDDPFWRPPWRCWNQDTIKHEDGNMQRIIQNGAWVGNVFPQAEKRQDGQYYSLIPEIISDAQVRAEHEWHHKENLDDIYAMEKLCQPMAMDGSAWTKELFRYYNESSLKLNNFPKEQKFIIVDPAKTSLDTSANSAGLCVAIDPLEEKIFFRDLFARRIKLDVLPYEIFNMAVSHNTPTIIVELTGQEEPVQIIWENALRKSGLSEWIELCWIDARGSTPQGDYGKGKEAPKRARASTLLPHYRSGVVYHEEGLRNGPLEQQQLSYPKCTLWDCLDCAGYVPKVAHQAGLWWQPRILDSEFKEILSKSKGYSDDDRTTRRIRDREWVLQ